jgi:hypothetical protein
MDMLGRFAAMQKDARERRITVSSGELCVLVLADVIEDQGLAAVKQLEEIDKSLVSISSNV